MTVSAENDGTKAVKMMVPLKYLSNFCKTLEINLILIWSANCVIFNAANN